VNKIMKIIRLRGRKGPDYKYRLILDVGTEYLKAALVEYSEKETNVIGYSRQKQKHGDMEGGSIADIDGVSDTAREALAEIRTGTPHSPQDVVMGIAGSFVKGISTVVEVSRKIPYRRISKKEINRLIQESRYKGQKEAEKMLKRETGQSRLGVRPINSAVVEMKADGFRVTNPLDFRANNLAITVFHSFCPMVHIGALNSLSRALRLPLAGTLAEPYAVASSILSAEAYEFGAIVIDIGGGTTDIGLIRNGGVEGTEILAMGGRAFTKSIASRLNISLQKAEDLKIKYSQNRLDAEMKRKVKPVVETNLRILYQGIKKALNRLSRGEALPKRIYFCGGGSAVKNLLPGLEQEKILDDLPYFEKPEVVVLKGEDLKGLGGDRSKLLGQENVTPAALICAGTSMDKIICPAPKQAITWG